MRRLRTPLIFATVVGISVLFVAQAYTSTSLDRANAASRYTLTVRPPVAEHQSPSKTVSLECSPRIGGSHPHAKAACAFLAAHPEIFHPRPTGMLCSDIAGTGSALLTGVRFGRPVRISFDRIGGCHMALWNEAKPLLDIFPASQWNR